MPKAFVHSGEVVSVKLHLWNIRVYWFQGGPLLYVGPWSIRFMCPFRWPLTRFSIHLRRCHWEGLVVPGRFTNGSKWQSGWHRWPDDPEF